MKPVRSYTIWFSQRTGSTLLYKALESTEVAGIPREWLTEPDPGTFGIQDIRQMWQNGTTPNGVFGLKTSSVKLDDWLHTFQRELHLPAGLSRPQIWEEAFPACKHIFMTRRNKVRLAVSWWRAIVSGEWHRVHGTRPHQEEIADKYSFDGINHLLVECTLREAGMEAFFAEERIVPMTIVYEDFIQNYEDTVMKVLNFLNIPTESVQVASPFFDPIADEIAESWVQRFREERQAGWKNIAW
ncbi:Stf0 family sulfotransferase [Paenibacillus eucommiae]|uniref:LPS sulfotransferase NodH n=1 Tax=Paenibacillus eucommiae TaxID=1355755 RepID=A0ABS4IPW4_9BACL|nr:Stf0 family sulfotransferase [Paenibacillus eucommiae]MBP1989604.1 LPS sulfotransferase NodH [Paenibacillus eucommiae]